MILTEKLELDLECPVTLTGRPPGLVEPVATGTSSLAGAFGSSSSVNEESGPMLSNLFSMFDLRGPRSSYPVLRGGCWG